MAFISDKPIVKETAHENIKCIKIVKLLDCGDITSAYFPKFIYRLNEQTEKTMLDKEEQFNPYALTVRQGYHSYDTNKCQAKHNDFFTLEITTKTLEGKEKILEAVNNPSKLYNKINDFKYALLECEIPKDTKYYTNEDGAIVSETIIPTKLIQT